jgi:hypothetical protein
VVPWDWKVAYLIDSEGLMDNEETSSPSDESDTSTSESLVRFASQHACLFCADGSVLAQSDMMDFILDDPDALRQVLSSLPSSNPAYLLCVLQLALLLNEKFRRGNHESSPSDQTHSD